MTWQAQIVLTALAVGGGFIMGWWLGRRACADLVEATDPDHLEHVEEPMPWKTQSGRRMLAAVGAFVVAATLFAFGAQQALYQSDQQAERERDRALTECLTNWGDEVVTTLQTRTGATAALDAAEDRRDDAVDDVLAVVVLIRRIPPEATFAELDARLAQFSRVKAELRAARRARAEAQAANPYVPPRLSCQAETEDKG